MSRETYNYKRKAITAALELLYPDSVIEALRKAVTETEIAHIMHTARKEN